MKKDTAGTNRIRFKGVLFYAVFSTVLTLAGIGGAYIMTRFGALPTATEYAAWEKYETFREGRFHNLEPNDFVAKKAVKKSGFLKFLFKSKNAPSFQIPQKQDRHDSSTPLKDAFSVYWLGHSSLIFELGDTRFMTDPVFGNAAPVPGIVTRYCEPPIRRDELPPLDFIIVSHDHYDHLEYDTIRALRHTDIIFVTPLGVGARLRSFGVKPENIRELYWYESTQIGNTTITATPGRHFSGRTLKDRFKTLWASWVIENGGRKIFFGGDSGYGKHFKDIGEKFGPFDLVCLEIDAWNENWKNNHMFPHEFPVAAKELNAKLAMPIHWAVFDLAMHPWKDSITMVSEEAEKAGLPLFTPMMGEIAYPGKTQTCPWWQDLPEH